MRIAFLLLNGYSSGFVAPIVDGLRFNSCQVDCFETTEPWDFTGYDYLLMYGPMQPIDRVVVRLAHTQVVPPIVFWLTEQLPNPSASTHLIRVLGTARFKAESRVDTLLRGSSRQAPDLRIDLRAGRLRIVGELLALHRLSLLKLVCVFSKTNYAILTRLGLPVAHVPMGHHDSFGADLNLDRDIDVVFLGSIRDKRRASIIGSLEKSFARSGIRFVIKDGSAERGAVHGHERTVLLNRSKVMLNIMRQPWDDLVFRQLLAAPNRTMILSEPLVPSALDPFFPHLHFATCETESIVDNVHHYLDHSAERWALVEQVHGFVTYHMTMEIVVRELLAQLYPGSGG